MSNQEFSANDTRTVVFVTCLSLFRRVDHYDRTHLLLLIVFCDAAESGAMSLGGDEVVMVCLSSYKR